MVAKAFNKNYLLLHLIVFIWGWTGIFGKVISLSALQLVWLRLPIALLGILGFILYKKISLTVSKTEFIKICSVGLIVAIHWVTFYGSIKESNVSIAVACFSSGSLFSAFIEPIFFKRKIVWYELLFGLMVIAALLLIFNVESKYKTGIVLGIVAAFTSALFGVLNGVMVKQGINSAKISLYEMLGGFIGLTIYVVCTGAFSPDWMIISTKNWIYMLLFGLVCTTLPFLIGMYILKEISPYTVSLTLNLETIYSIILAFFLFHEHEQMTTGFFIGTLIILSTIFVNGFIKSYLKK